MKKKEYTYNYDSGRKVNQKINIDIITMIIMTIIIIIIRIIITNESYRQ